MHQAVLRKSAARIEPGKDLLLKVAEVVKTFGFGLKQNAETLDELRYILDGKSRRSQAV